MRKILLVATVAATAAGAAWAQAPMDVKTLADRQMRGTARFMSMGGAFTALGGDLSTLNQNPAGIGVYRSSDIGFTLDVDILGEESPTTKKSLTHVDVNNFGYIGTANLSNSAMETFSWGFSYSRQNSFRRQYGGNIANVGTSLSNYIASFTTGNAADMEFGNNYNPYFDSGADWASILAYSSYMISPLTSGGYMGLYDYNSSNLNGVNIPATSGDASFLVNESGYTDEYSINFGGNVSNVVYWGVGVGITDMSFNRSTQYGEYLVDAQGVPAIQDDKTMTYGKGDVDNVWGVDKTVSGTGVNLKLGLILKPINEFRIGLAVHTPTWYNLSTSYSGWTTYNYRQIESYTNDEAFWVPENQFVNGSDYTDDAYMEWKLRTPWRLMVGMAGVIGGRAIISADYEYDAFNKMHMKDSYGNNMDFFNSYVGDAFQAVNTLRLGAEFRITPKFSLRAGYVYSSSNMKSDYRDGNLDEVPTDGCDFSYTTGNDTQYITCGVGYRYKGFYADFAYVHRHRESTYHAFSPFSDPDYQTTAYENPHWVDFSPTAKLKQNSSQLVFTVGYKF